MVNNTKTGKKKKLGRGLASLIGEISRESVDAQSNESIVSANNSGEKTSTASDKLVPVGMIAANDENPRQHFSIDELEELSNSIKKYGIVQPILVRPGRTNDANVRYKLIAGERRWQAAQRAGLHEVPVIIRQVSDSQALELALIENIHRSDLNPIEEAMGYKRLMDDYEYRQEDLAKILGKSRSHVANMLRLLNLPEEVIDYVRIGKLSNGHARTLVGFAEAKLLAEKIIKEKLSVRDTEKYIAKNSNVADIKNEKYQPTADDIALERKLSETTGLVFSVKPKNSSSGKIIIQYKDMDILNNFIDKILIK